MLKTSELHDKIFELLINEQASPTDATIALSHVILNIGVSEIESLNHPTLFVASDGVPSLSMRSECRQVRLDITVGYDLPASETVSEPLSFKEIN